jgi:hypothetical protein
MEPLDHFKVRVEIIKETSNASLGRTRNARAGCEPAGSLRNHRDIRALLHESSMTTRTDTAFC